MNIEIRPERADDADTIRDIKEAAFKLNDHSSGAEGAIIDALREADALTISLVAVHRRSWKNCEEVEFEALKWVNWFNKHRLLEPIGNIPPAEYEALYYAQITEHAMAV